MDRDWAVCPRDEKQSRWSAPYATLNPSGDIVISRFTYEAVGAPEGFLLMFDRANATIGLKPAAIRKEKDAYPARTRGRHGGRVIRGYRLCREFGIRLDQTIKFPHATIDKDSILLLDLNDAQSAARRRY